MNPLIASLPNHATAQKLNPFLLLWRQRALAAHAFALLFTGMASASDSPGEEPPARLGRLADIGGYKLHIWCTGKESDRIVEAIRQVVEDTCKQLAPTSH